MGSMASKMVGLIVASAFVSGCCIANTTLLPQGSQASVIATSRDGDCCTRRALERAQEHCDKQGLLLNVLNEKTVYQGVDQRAKTAVGIVGAITGTNANLDTDEDYRTELKFQCDSPVEQTPADSSEDGL